MNQAYQPVPSRFADTGKKTGPFVDLRKFYHVMPRHYALDVTNFCVAPTNSVELMHTLAALNLCGADGALLASPHRRKMGH